MELITKCTNCKNTGNKYALEDNKGICPLCGGNLVIINISCVNGRYWSTHCVDRFFLVVDIYRNGIGKYPETYFYDSMEGEHSRIFYGGMYHEQV